MYRLEAVSPEKDELTFRQRQVLELSMEGLTQRQIALRLSVSEHTVVKHVRTAYERLGVHNRAEAIVKALTKGLIIYRQAGHAPLCPRCGCRVSDAGGTVKE